MKKWMKIGVPILLLVVALFLFVYLNVAYFVDDFIYERLYFHDVITTIMKVITFLGEPYFIILFFLLYFLYCLIKRKFQNFNLLFILSFIGVGAVGVTKQIVRRNRPTISQLIPINDFSFPSGHAFISMLIYGYFIYLIYTEVKSSYKWIYIFLLGFLILLIGFSRIYLGVHYTTDVICGYCLGFLFLSLGILAKQKILKEKQL